MLFKTGFKKVHRICAEFINNDAQNFQLFLQNSGILIIRQFMPTAQRVFPRHSLVRAWERSRPLTLIAAYIRPSGPLAHFIRLYYDFDY